MVDRGAWAVAGALLLSGLAAMPVVVAGQAGARQAEIAGLTWVRVPAGSFQMGCVPADTECAADERPRHAVTLSRPFDLLATEVSVAQFREMRAQAGTALPAQPPWSTERSPAVNVTWDDATAACRLIGGRLPTEAEWEYAARAGRVDARFPWGDAAPVCEDGQASSARFSGCAVGAAATGFSAPNAFGLRDMAGNAWEWVADGYSAQSYSSASVTDPRGPKVTMWRALRGGSWDDLPQTLRVSARHFDRPEYRYDGNGFRCARDIRR